MDLYTTLIQEGKSFLPFLITLAVLMLVLWSAHRVLIGRHPDLGNEKKFPRQIILMVLSFACLIMAIVVLPVSESIRNQIIGLIGLVTSGIFAFSSSTVFANLMGGIMMRMTKPFRTGDFITVGDHFGRVTERGLLDTEIQTEERRLVALPNTYLITHPVSVVRSSGAIVSVTLSLGYDVHHGVVEPLLIKAAEDSGLEEVFVQITELGNYSISYKICGLLVEVKSLISARTALSRSLLDTLHRSEIEVMSPTIMNQRRIADDYQVIPKSMKSAAIKPAVLAEDLVFDKAEQAEQTEKEKLDTQAEIKELEVALKEAEGENKELLKIKIEEVSEKLKLLNATEASPLAENNTQQGN